MIARLMIAAAGLLLVSWLTLRASARAVRVRRWVGGAVRGLVGVLLLALAALAGAGALGLRGYSALTREEVAATVTTAPVSAHHFRATIVLPDRRLAMYDFLGDAFYVDAHILKWHPVVNLLGLHTAYELDRVAGRYNDVTDERARPHTVFSLTRARPVNLFAIAKSGLLGPLVDAEYGSASFVAATRPATYEVRVSTTGLLMRYVLNTPPPSAPPLPPPERP
jgi:hypothetical protein